MKVVLQRVREASVTVSANRIAEIGQGLLILLGIEAEDTKEDIDWLIAKIAKMRIFSDTEGAMNLSIRDVNGEVIVVSQFTLYASTKKGNRPSFIKAARPEIAMPLYKQFVEMLEVSLEKKVQTGEFGAMMDIALINDGPVTIVIDSKERN